VAADSHRGELREAHVGQSGRPQRLVNTYRATTIKIFIDLRDRYGLTQVVFEATTRVVRRRREVRNEWFCQCAERSVNVCLTSTTQLSTATSRFWPAA